MAISRAQALKELLPGLNALFGLEYKKYENEHEAIYETESSERSFEEEVKLSGFGQAPVKAEGSAISYDNAQESFTARYNHETVAMGYERGLLIAARPRKLIIPAALMFVATRLLQTEGRVGTADNDLNALRTNGSIPEGYGVNHYLTDTDAWFLTTDIPNGMKHFVRTAMATGMDGDFDTGNVRYKARERYSFGVSDPLGIYGSQGA
jgi:hypothetical protein